MKPKLKLLLSALLAFYAAAPFTAGARELTEADAQMVLDCINNVDPAKNLLSPAKADECNDQFTEGGGELMEKASQDFPTLAVQAVARNNALADLRDIIVKYEGMPMASGLTRVLTERSVLRQMNLGPKPESVTPWVAKYLQGREAAFKKGIRSWDALGQIRTTGLKTQSEASWDALIPADRDNSKPDRYKTLYFWARDAADDLLKTAAVAAKAKDAAKEYGPLVQVLKEDLEPFGDKARIAKLDKFLEGLGVAAKAPPAGPSAADKKGKDVLDAANRLNGAAAGGRADTFLARTFDNAKEAGGADGVGLGGKAGAFTPVPITDAQAAQLGPRMGEVKDGKFTGALANEMRGTKAGDELVTFFEDPKLTKAGGNALNLKFEKGTGDTENALGWYSSDDKVTRINTSMVDKFCADRKITPEDLLKDEKAMGDLAAYVAPTFVHETTHQRQDVWNTQRGFNFLRWTDPATGKVDKFSPYQMEMEAEAFGMNGAFVAEKTQKLGPGYLQKLDKIDRADAERYLEDGVDGLRKQYHGNSYTGIDSMRGEAARQINAAAYTAQRVNTLAQKAQQKDAVMTPAELQELREGREALKTRFGWYKDTLAKSKTDELKLLDWRGDIDPEGKVLGTLKTSLLPEPGGE
ncbi:MAG: hypothetical protein PHV33_05580 [Elusimicrobiales bacterium]|nr:hypothetical protein [Elusimicrobiales bacterium]